MRVTGLFHCAIKTNDLAATVAFYTKVLGLREVARPDFGYPGAWLACPAPGGDAIVHIYAAPALGRQGKSPRRHRRHRSPLARGARLPRVPRALSRRRSGLARVPRARHHALAALRL